MKWQSLFTDHEINHWSTKTIVLKQWGGRDLAKLTCWFILIHRVHIFQAHADLSLFFAVFWPSLVLRVFSPTWQFQKGCYKVNVQWRLWKLYFYRSRIHFFVDPFVSLFNLQRSLPKKSVKTVFARIIL